MDVAKRKTSNREQDPGFEESLAQVEAIIRQIESGELGLERSLAEYERGAALVKRCQEILSAAEERMEEITASLRSRAPEGSHGEPDAEPEPER